MCENLLGGHKQMSVLYTTYLYYFPWLTDVLLLGVLAQVPWG